MTYSFDKLQALVNSKHGADAVIMNSNNSTVLFYYDYTMNGKQYREYVTSRYDIKTNELYSGNYFDTYSQDKEKAYQQAKADFFSK